METFSNVLIWNQNYVFNILKDVSVYWYIQETFLNVFIL